ncbi:hypothetical protein ATO13_06270 [Stappia sp. 22II-S9-Z10]|nr:hypothetical protein ATO13_06270 [Stappia sp. 22II-S9-Z10]
MRRKCRAPALAAAPALASARAVAPARAFAVSRAFAAAVGLAAVLTGLWPLAASAQGSLPGSAPVRPVTEPVTSGFNIFRRLAGGSGGAEANKAALLAAYPGAFRFEGNHAVFPSGTRIVWDDGRTKSPDQLLTDPDLEDMFHYPYPAGAGISPPGRDQDPGRIRNDTFFRALYGASEGDVRSTLVAVPWVPSLGGGRLMVTRRFGVDRQLSRVSAELERLAPQFHTFLVPSAGTFNWRAIAGTDRMSVHSFGAAIDINTRHTNYWRWDEGNGDGTLPYKNKIPLEVVKIFEKYCFVWGGRWYHYDTMHFEYRPELLPDCRRN